MIIFYSDNEEAFDVGPLSNSNSAQQELTIGDQIAVANDKEVDVVDADAADISAVEMKSARPTYTIFDKKYLNFSIGVLSKYTGKLMCRKDIL